MISSTATGVPQAPRIREALLRELARDREEVRGGSTTLSTCLVGAPDLGTAWVVEAARRAAEQEGFDTLLCRAEKDDALAPLSLFRGALASWHRSGEPASTETEGSSREISPHGPLELTTLVLGAGLAPEPEGGAPDASAATQEEYDRLVRSLADANQAALEKRSRLLTQIRRFLVDRAREAPLLLALEDLELADAVSADLVAVLLEWRTEVPLWLLLTYSAEEDLAPPLRRALERTFLSRTAVRRPLAPMDTTELRRFLDEGAPLRAPVPPSVLEEVVGRSQGMPGVALRLVRAYQTQGTLPKMASEEGGREEEDGAPALTEEQERLLSLASVAGPSSSFELLRRSFGGDEERTAELLEELVHLGFLVERTGAVYEFSEEGTRQRTYKELTAARRRVLHRKVAEAVEGLPGGKDASRIFALTYHFTQGKVDPKALEYLRSALELARAAGSLPREKDLLEQMLSVQKRVSPQDARGEALLLHEMGSVAYALGQDEAASLSLSRSRDLLRNLHEGGSPYAGVLLDLARVTARRGDVAVARTLADEALERFRGANDPLGIAWVLRFRSRISYGAGEYPGAREDLQGCLEALERARAPRVEIGRTLTAIADVEFMLDPSSREASTRKLEEGIAMLLQAGDRAGALFAELGRAAIERSLNDEKAARETDARTRALVPEVPEVWRLMDAMLRKASNHIAKGELKEAQGLADTSVELARVLGDREREGRALIYATDIAGRLALIDRAEARAKEALEVGRAASHRRTEVEALYRLAIAAQLRGDGPLRDQRVREAEGLVEGLELSRTAQMLRRDLRDLQDEGRARGTEAGP
ncbi:MAG: hypothetical protein KGJ23_14380 [Euryarchaeota archaeon]|nr:hypothetical protein [Euryarchaeota archaeon]MDE1881293.1 hypothetical protein [Euryarchaeota archaeon]MDE2046170.1 hypothetical protein [Thermoplasmata archaeon]